MNVDHTSRQSAVFLFACGVAFVASVAATVCFCRSMCCEMEMPGGWTIPHYSATILPLSFHPTLLAILLATLGTGPSP